MGGHVKTQEDLNRTAAHLPECVQIGDGEGLINQVIESPNKWVKSLPYRIGNDDL